MRFGQFIEASQGNQGGVVSENGKNRTQSVRRARHPARGWPRQLSFSEVECTACQKSAALQKKPSAADSIRPAAHIAVRKNLVAPMTGN